MLAGHTHVDQFHVLGNDNFDNSGNDNVENSGRDNFEDSANEPFATWFSPGSVVQYGGKNPAFRIYKYNRNAFDLVNYFHYRFDTKRSNEEGKPHWFKAYDAQSEYGVKDISASSMNKVAFGMAVNETLWQRFQINYQNDVPQTNPLGRN